MMPISRIETDQNIERVYTKMSEDFPSIVDQKNNAKKLLLSKSVDAVNYFEKKVIGGVVDATSDDLARAYDHMYASNTENGEISLADPNNCQTAESEVKFWKEWLILHLDLIQQQSDEILDKERTILILQQENEMLKERISCMERGAPFQPSKFYNDHHTEPYIYDNFGGDNMTQDSGPCDEDNKNCIELLDLNCAGVDGGADELKLLSNYGHHQTNNHLNNSVSDTESQTEANLSLDTNPKYESSQLDSSFEVELDNSKGEVAACDTVAGEGYDFTIDNKGDLDPMRNLRMSIRRKRLSDSSALSNNDSAVEEKRAFRRFRKKRKRVVKNSQLLTTPDQYVTQAADLNLGVINDVSVDITNFTTLEVPRWRVKVYASCYSMEGTENLDDEVFNKRHSRLENDERRRKRWDVQRIREQRVIEKLKQRQERIGSGSRVEDPSDIVPSLWPKLEDLKFLEVADQLPVAAFGCPIPKIPPSEFALPWVHNPAILVTNKKPPVKKSSSRRRRR